MTTIQQQQQ